MNYTFRNNLWKGENSTTNSIVPSNSRPFTNLDRNAAATARTRSTATTRRYRFGPHPAGRTAHTQTRRTEPTAPRAGSPEQPCWYAPAGAPPQDV